MFYRLFVFKLSKFYYFYLEICFIQKCLFGIMEEDIKSHTTTECQGFDNVQDVFPFSWRNLGKLDKNTPYP